MYLTHLEIPHSWIGKCVTRSIIAVFGVRMSMDCGRGRLVLTRGDLSMDVDAVVLATGDLSMDSSTFGCPWTHFKK